MHPPEHLFLIGKRDGFSPELGTLVSMMEYTRATTLMEIRDLTPEQLDFLPHPEGNSIGMLALHIAAVEAVYQILTFEGREEPNAEEAARWNAALELGEEGRKTIRGHSADFYIQTLAEVREKTLAAFRERDDAFLQITRDWWDDRQSNNFFAWFHVFEDELNHRGQMRLIRNRYLEQKA